ncbi:MAG: sucrase ferredoxin [Nannocystaceae bacterium]
MSAATSCSRSSESAGECLPGTATAETHTWLLVEDCGVWGKRVPQELSPTWTRPVAERVSALLNAHTGARLQLIRRGAAGRGRGLQVFVAQVRGAGGAGPRDGEGPCALSDSKPLLVSRTVQSLMELDTLDLAHPEVWGEVDKAPVYLVCTHGRRDACCARKGVPLYRAVEALVGDRAWQTSHLGGHRFAPVLLTLPHGYMYGRIEVAECQELVQATDAGRVGIGTGVESRVRGRVDLSAVQQAAECFLRDALAENSFGALEPAGVEARRPVVVGVPGHGTRAGGVPPCGGQVAAQRWISFWKVGARRYEVETERVPGALPVLKSCGDETGSLIGTMRLLGWREV